jgi:hypothetical protein
VQAGFGEDVLDARELQLGVQLAGQRSVSAETSLRTSLQVGCTTCSMQASSERGMSARSISSSATRAGVMTSR